MQFNKVLIDKGAADNNIYFGDKPFFIKLLNQMLTITEHKDYTSHSFETDDDIYEFIEFDRDHDNILKNYPSNKIDRYIIQAISLYMMILDKYKDRFVYMSGSEIATKRKKLREEKLKNSYYIFCNRMNELWKEWKIEEQLLNNGHAYIYSEGCEYPFDLTGSEKITNKIKGKITKNSLLAGKQYYPLKEDECFQILMNEFYLNFDEFFEFMKNHEFEWELGIEAYRIERPSYFTQNIFDLIISIIKNKWLVTSYKYVIKIWCKGER